MGADQHSGTAHNQLEVCKTAFGKATVKLTNIYLSSVEENRDKLGTQFFVKLTVTNQTKTSKNLLPHQFNNINFESQFAINSRHLPQGRTLNVQLYERGSIIQASLVGLGVLDLDFVLKQKYLQNMKIYLNNESDKAGWVEVKGQFLPCETNVLTIMFDSAILRRRTSFGTMHCKVKTQIGQQVLYTSVSQDKKDQPANWKGEAFTFYYLKNFQKEGTITVYDDDKIIGSMILNLEEFEQTTQPWIQINEQFHFQKQIAGNIKFIISKGQKIDQKYFLNRSVIVSPLKKNEADKPIVNEQKNQKPIQVIQEPKVQLIKQPQVIKQQENLKTNDKGQLKKQDQNLLLFYDDQQPIPKKKSQIKRVKDQFNSSQQQINEFDPKDPKNIQNRPPSQNRLYVQDAVLSPQQNIKLQTQSLSPILNK